uniref:imidazole glycerol phosphate synthase subunit HisH n=1 Tax=Pararhizobium sp. IMCC3301 TaxID=3067904 RepID=UPI002742201B|nr:imidazole glycerol phosphate synthase subunit HisH [Pararhizobium sp. IMCC3301]
MIAIIDYGAGNVRSVMNMLRALNAEARIVTSGDELGGASRIILPGVGHFDHGMALLAERGFIEPLNHLVLKQRLPFLGICLGAQLIARGSEEGDRPGLGWVNADVVAFDRSRLPANLRVPHMGWAETWAPEAVIAEGTLPRCFADTFNAKTRFYYVHSYHLLCDDQHQAALRSWHGYEFAAGIVADNILGMQFHPEKSHEHGKKIFSAFLTWQPVA